MLKFMKELLDRFLDFIIMLLPTSPFAGVIDELAQFPYLSYVNWLIPFGDLLAIGGTWLIAVAGFYLYSVIARWIKLIN